jgi:hypothetical protein
MNYFIHRAQRKKLKTTFKVVEYRGGCVRKRSKVTVPVQITLPGQSSLFGQASTSDHDILSNAGVNELDQYDESIIDSTCNDNEDEDHANEIPQYGKQSVIKTCVRQYRKRKEAEIKAWSNIRRSMLDKYIQSMALTKDTSCCFC